MRDDRASSQAALLRVEATYEGAEAIITDAGQLDHSTAERFVACLLEVVDSKPRSIPVDALGSRSRTPLACPPRSGLVAWPSLTKWIPDQRPIARTATAPSGESHQGLAVARRVTATTSGTHVDRPPNGG